MSYYVNIEDYGFPSAADPLNIEWKLRYGVPTRSVVLVAASYVAAYKQMVRDTREKRQKVVAALRADMAERASEEEK